MCKDEVDGNPYTILMYMYIYLYVMILIHVLQMYMYKTPFHVYTIILELCSSKFSVKFSSCGEIPGSPAMYVHLHV